MIEMVTKEPETLEEFAQEYIDLKEEVKPLNDRVDYLGDTIKKKFESDYDEDSRYINVGEKSLSMSYRTKDVYDEDKVIELLKDKKLADAIVKTKEYVDFDELERAIYNESLPKDVLKKILSFKHKVVTAKVLNIKKRKDK